MEMIRPHSQSVSPPIQTVKHNNKYMQSWLEHATLSHTVSISAQQSHVILQQGGMCIYILMTYTLNYRMEIYQAVAMSFLL